MPETTCAAPFCSRTGRHIFPKDKKRRDAWAHAIRRGKNKFEKWSPSKYSYLCEKHFTEDDYHNSSYTHFGTARQKRALKRTAVPSVFQWSCTETLVKNKERQDRTELRASKRRKLFEDISSAVNNAPIPDEPQFVAQKVDFVSDDLDVAAEMDVNTTSDVELEDQSETSATVMVDAEVQTDASATVTVDAEVQTDASATVMVDAEMQTDASATVMVDAEVQTDASATVMVDAEMQTDASATVMVDAEVQTDASATVMVDAEMQTDASATVMVDAEVQTDASATVMVDAEMQTDASATVMVDAEVQTDASATVMVDAEMQTDASATVMVDAEMQTDASATVMVDAEVQTDASATVMVDAEVQTDASATVTVDAEVQTDASATVMVDAEMQTAKIPGFSINNFVKDDAGVHFYTGLENYDKFFFVLRTLGPAACYLNYIYHSVVSVSVPDQFFIVLIKLRTHKTNFEISRMFSISESVVTNIFITWIMFMSKQWGELNIWPSREVVQHFAPSSFRRSYPNTRVTVDGTECPIKKPKNPIAQQATFSTYKNRNTVKVLVGITPGGLVSYVSDSYGGSTSDRQIVERSALTKMCDKQDSIMADKGFNVQDIFAPFDVHINMPTFFKKKNRMNGEIVMRDRKIASKRVHVERVIGLAKTYRILVQPMTASEIKLSSEIIFICFMLCNFRYSIVSAHA